MTVDEFSNELDGKLNEIATGKAFFTSAGFLKDAMANRIFERGEKTEGGKSTYNDTTEIWVADNIGPKKGDKKGKPNKAGVQKSTKTTYYTSYKTFKQAMTNKSSFVDFMLNRELRSDFDTSVVQKEPNSLELRVSELSAKKIEGSESRFGTYFEPTEEEANDFVQLVTDEINLIMTR
jgi:hypothetical protein